MLRFLSLIWNFQFLPAEMRNLPDKVEDELFSTLFLFLTFQKHPEECCEMEVAENHVDIAPDWNYGLIVRMFSRASDKGLKKRKRIIKEIKTVLQNTCINAAKIQARSVKMRATNNPMWILCRRHLISLNIKSCITQNACQKPNFLNDSYRFRFLRKFQFCQFVFRWQLIKEGGKEKETNIKHNWTTGLTR